MKKGFFAIFLVISGVVIAILLTANIIIYRQAGLVKQVEQVDRSSPTENFNDLIKPEEFNDLMSYLLSK